jgi:hypothetical protein
MSTTQSIGGTDTIITLDNVDISSTNTSSLLTSNANEITCVATGVYMIIGRINWTGTPGQGAYLLNIRVGGTIQQTIDTGVSASGLLGVQPPTLGQTISGLVNITTANTNIQLSASNTAGTYNIGGSGSIASWLFVQRIS